MYVHRIVLQSFEKSPVCLLLVCLPSCRKCWCGAFFAVIVLTVLVVTANNACKIVSLIYAYVHQLLGYNERMSWQLALEPDVRSEKN